MELEFLSKSAQTGSRSFLANAVCTCRRAQARWRHGVGTAGASTACGTAGASSVYLCYDSHDSYVIDVIFVCDSV